MNVLAVNIRQVAARELKNGNHVISNILNTAADEIERADDEAKEWRDRYEAELADHQATIRQADGLLNELNGGP